VLLLAVFARGGTPDTTAEGAFEKVAALLQDTEIPAAYLRTVFSDEAVQIHPEIVDRFAHPPEKQEYPSYRRLFVTEARIQGGVAFYREHQAIITAVADSFGVDPYLLVSIVGVESNYGRVHRDYGVFNALYTILRRIPRRADWAARELAEFLKYCYRDGINPHELHGSYAGAFGYGQFIPSSFNRFAIDFDGDGVRHPYHWSDVLGSIANYLASHGYDPDSGDFTRDSRNWKAIYAYNHADNYVKVIVELQEEIESALAAP
jgi:membrane-bound lytic murein transglycosylase B